MSVTQQELARLQAQARLAQHRTQQQQLAQTQADPARDYVPAAPDAGEYGPPRPTPQVREQLTDFDPEAYYRGIQTTGTAPVLGQFTQPAATVQSARQRGQGPVRTISQIYPRVPAVSEAPGISGIPANFLRGVVGSGTEVLNQAIWEAPASVIQATANKMQDLGMLPKNMGTVPRDVISRLYNAGEYESVRPLYESSLKDWVEATQYGTSQSFLTDRAMAPFRALNRLNLIPNQYGEGDYVGFQTRSARLGRSLGVGALVGIGSTAVAPLMLGGYPSIQGLNQFVARAPGLQGGVASSDLVKNQFFQQLYAPRSSTNPLGGLTGPISTFGARALDRLGISHSLSPQPLLAGTRTAVNINYPARFIENPAALAAAEVGLGGVGNLYYQGVEEVFPGYGTWGLVLPLSMVAAGKEGFRKVGGFSRHLPSRQAFNYFGKQDVPLTPEETGGIDPRNWWQGLKTGFGRLSRDASDVTSGTGSQRRRGAAQKVQGRIDAELNRQENQFFLQRTLDLQKKLEESGLEPLNLSPGRESGSRILLTEEQRIIAAMDPEKAAEYRDSMWNNIRIMNDWIEGQLAHPVIDDGGNILLNSETGDAVWAAPSYILDEATKRIQLVQAQTRDQLDTVTRELAELSGNVGDETVTASGRAIPSEDPLAFPSASGPGRAEYGQTIRGIWQDYRNYNESIVNKLSEDLGINQRNSVGYLESRTATVFDDQGRPVVNADGTAQQVETTAPRDELLDILNMPRASSPSEWLSGRATNKLVQDFIEYRPENGELRFQDWRRFRSQVTTEMRNASGEEKKDLMALKTVLDNMMYGPAGNFQTATGNYKAFADMYRSLMIDPFEQASVSKITRTGAGTRAATAESPAEYVYLLPDEQVGTNFLTDTTSARQFMQMVGYVEDPALKARMVDGMRSTILDEAATASGARRNGEIDNRRLNEWVAKNRETFDIIMVNDPVTGAPIKASELLGNVSNRAGDLLARQSQLTARKKSIEQAQLDRLLRSDKLQDMGSLERTQAVYDTAISRALEGDTTLLGELKNAALGPGTFDGAQEALNARVWDHIWTRSLDNAPIGAPAADTAIANVNRFSALLGRNEAGLRRIMGDVHYDNMIVALDGFERITQLNFANAGAFNRDTLVDGVARMTGVTPQGWSARTINSLEGRVGGKTTGVWLGAQAWRAGVNRTMDKVMEEAITNPEWARALSRYVADPSAITNEQAGHLRRLMFNSGIVDPSSYEAGYSDPLGQPYPRREPIPEVIEQEIPLRDEPQLEPETDVVGPPRPTAALPPVATPTLPSAPQSNPSLVAQQPTENNTQNYSSLFPYDPLGQAVAEKETARDRSGIMSLLG
jgi:hypothetical protein